MASEYFEIPDFDKLLPMPPPTRPAPKKRPDISILKRQTLKKSAPEARPCFSMPSSDTPIPLPESAMANPLPESGCPPTVAGFPSRAPVMFLPGSFRSLTPVGPSRASTSSPNQSGGLEPWIRRDNPESSTTDVTIVSVTKPSDMTEVILISESEEETVVKTQDETLPTSGSGELDDDVFEPKTPSPHPYVTTYPDPEGHYRQKHRKRKQFEFRLWSSAFRGWGATPESDHDEPVTQRPRVDPMASPAFPESRVEASSPTSSTVMIADTPPDVLKAERVAASMAARTARYVAQNIRRIREEMDTFFAQYHHRPLRPDAPTSPTVHQSPTTSEDSWPEGNWSDFWTEMGASSSRK